MYKALATKYIRTSTVMMNESNVVVFSSRLGSKNDLPAKVAESLEALGAVLSGSTGRMTMSVELFTAVRSNVESVLLNHVAEKDAADTKARKAKKKAHRKHVSRIRRAVALKWSLKIGKVLALIVFGAAVLAGLTVMLPYIIGFGFLVLVIAGLGNTSTEDLATGYVMGKIL